MGLKLLIGGSPCTHWRPVPGYTGLYEVSEDGKVRNARTKRVLSRKTERNGYVRVHLSMDGDLVRLWGSIKEASAFLGVNPSTVVCVCKGKRRYKSTGGYKFRYAGEVVLHG